MALFKYLVKSGCKDGPGSDGAWPPWEPCASRRFSREAPQTTSHPLLVPLFVEVAQDLHLHLDVQAHHELLPRRVVQPCHELVLPVVLLVVVLVLGLGVGVM